MTRPHLPADQLTVPQLRAELRARCTRGFDNGITPNADGTWGLPKAISAMRKAELVAQVIKARAAQVEQERAALTLASA